MDFYNKVKSFFGLPTQTYKSQLPEQNQRDNTLTVSQHEDNFNSTRRDEISPFDNHTGRGFSVFTDPLEIHKYFEQQMEDVLRNFGFGNLAGPFINEFEDDRHGEEFSQPRGDLRDQFLKPGYDRAISDHKLSDKVDKDIDGALNLGELDSVLEGNTQRSPAVKPNIRKKSLFSGFGTTQRTIINGDGSMEMHSTVRDSQGNEETTITKKIGDKEYTVIKRRNREGKEEIVENFVNVTQDEVAKYFPSVATPPNDSYNSSLFDKFFKQ